MNLQKTILDFFVRYGASFITPEGETVHGCLSRVSGEDEPKELVHLPLGYRPAHRVRLLTQGDFPLAENQTLYQGAGRRHSCGLPRCPAGAGGRPRWGRQGRIKKRLAEAFIRICRAVRRRFARRRPLAAVLRAALLRRAA